MAQGKKRRGQMTDAEAARRAEAVRREIRVLGDPVLRDHAHVVRQFDGQLRKLAFHMIDVMRDAPGVGLAAPQLGVSKRLIVYEVGDEEEPHILANPEIVWRSDEVEDGEEGCLSVPDVVVPVDRSTSIEVRGQDVHGDPLEIRAEGLEARVIQHEVDHLDGVLILDRTSRKERAAALRELRERVMIG
jgi:peptide deformylase